MARFRPALEEHGEVAGALGPDDWSEMAFPVLGVDAHVAVKAGGPMLLIDAQHRASGLEARWDLDRPDSVLAQVVAAEGRLVPVDEETYALVEAAADRADGVTLDPVLTRLGVAPEAELDLDGLIRAAVADLVAVELVEDGATAALVDVGGTVRLAGDGEWAVDLGRAGIRIGLGGGAVATATAEDGSTVTVIDEDALSATLRAAADAPDDDPRPTLRVDAGGEARRTGGFEAFERP